MPCCGNRVLESCVARDLMHSAGRGIKTSVAARIRRHGLDQLRNLAIELQPSCGEYLAGLIAVEPDLAAIPATDFPAHEWPFRMG
jgi:hypothetical protein